MFTQRLNKIADIKRKVFTQGNTGEVLETWNIINSYKTRYAPKKNNSISENIYKKTDEAFLFFFDINVDVKLQDEILVDNNTYQITAIEFFDGYKNVHHCEVEAKKITLI